MFPLLELEYGQGKMLPFIAKPVARPLLYVKPNVHDEAFRHPQA